MHRNNNKKRGCLLINTSSSSINVKVYLLNPIFNIDTRTISTKIVTEFINKGISINIQAINKLNININTCNISIRWNATKQSINVKSNNIIDCIDTYVTLYNPSFLINLSLLNKLHIYLFKTNIEVKCNLLCTDFHNKYEIFYVKEGDFIFESDETFKVLKDVLQK